MWGVMWGAPTILSVAVPMFLEPMRNTDLHDRLAWCSINVPGHCLPLAVLRSTTPSSRVSRDTDPRRRPAPSHETGPTRSRSRASRKARNLTSTEKAVLHGEVKPVLHASAIALQAEFRPDGDHRPDRSTVFLTSPSADLILVGVSGKRLIWPGGGVWPPGGIHDFADEFLEDVFEGDHGLGMAVLVDEAGEVQAAGTQGCERGLQGGGGPDLTEGADPAVVHRHVPAGLVGVQDVGDVDITD